MLPYAVPTGEQGVRVITKKVQNMKTTTLSYLSFLFLFCISVDAQIRQGTINPSAMISYQRSTSEIKEGKYMEEYKYIDFTVITEFYYLIDNNLAIGPMINYWNWKSYTSYSNNSDESISLGFGLKYFHNYGKIFPFIAASFTYEIEEDQDKMPDFNIDGGIDFFIAENVAIEPRIRYHIQNREYSSYSSKTKIFTFITGLSIFIPNSK